jgi:hypothetical protein
MRSPWTVACLALVGLLPFRPVVHREAPGNPCSLLTAKEVSGILGIKSLPGRPFLNTSKTVCFYSADTTFTPASRSATVQIVTPAAFDFGKQMSTKGPLAGRSAGVGHESYWVSGGSYAKLGVRKGSRAFSITVTPGPTKATPDQLAGWEKALAKDAVARL